jgi:hypothetical protein
MKQTRHLSAEELIDLAERTCEPSLDPHLQSCEACRQELAALHSAISAAAEADVPEPSPLFWRHLSERVQDAVAAEPAARAETSRFPRGDWAKALPSWRGWAMAGVAAALTISIYMTTPRPSDPAAGTPDIAVVSSDIDTVPLAPGGATDDLSLALVADLTSQMDPDAFDETGWTSHAGAVDEAVDALTDDERLELQRLLKEALAKS